MKRFKKILYVNESNADQASAISRAVSLAENNQADLTVADVIPPPVAGARVELPPDVPAYTELQAAIVDDHWKALEFIVESYKQRLTIRLDLMVGKRFLEVIRAVLRNDYDLVIKPAENPTWARRLFGSDDMHLLRKCPCPVWLVKTSGESNYNAILAAVDFDPLNPVGSMRELNREILELASSQALSDFASLHLVHAWEPLLETTMLSRGCSSSECMADYVARQHALRRKGLYVLAEELHQWIGDDAYNYLSPRFHLPKGPAEMMIAPLAAELRAGVVVMGTIARTGISGLIFGNTAEAILGQLSCSVLAIKPPGFETPVKQEA